MWKWKIRKSPPLQTPQGWGTRHQEIHYCDIKTGSGASCDSLLLNLFGQVRINLQRVALKYFLLVFRAEDGRSVDVAARVVEVVAGFRVDALDGADHFRGEEDVVRGNHFGHAIDSRLVVHAGVEVHVLEQKVFERRALHVLRDAAIAAPVIGYRAPAV